MCTCVCGYTYIHVHALMCTCVCDYTYIHALMCTCVCGYTYIHALVCMCVCGYTYMHGCVHAHVRSALFPLSAHLHDLACMAPMLFLQFVHPAVQFQSHLGWALIGGGDCIHRGTGNCVREHGGLGTVVLTRGANHGAPVSGQLALLIGGGAGGKWDTGYG